MVSRVSLVLILVLFVIVGIAGGVGGYWVSRTPSVPSEEIPDQEETVSGQGEQGEEDVGAVEEEVATDDQAGAYDGSQTYIATFTLNIQDFSYPELSAALLTRLVAAHEERHIPVEVFLTTTMIDIFSEDYPDLWQQLTTSPVVDLSYHFRPPVPYHNVSSETIDWSSLSAEEAYELVYAYETHGLDLETGEPTDELGSFAKLASLLGHSPTCVGAAATAPAAKAVHQVFADLGVRCIVENATYTDLGEYLESFWIRPQHVDVKLFEQLSTPSQQILDEAKETASQIEGAVAPYFLNVKMHDNDFFATDSAWTTVYLAPGARRDGPPYDTSLASDLLSEAEQQNVYDAYVSMLDAALEDADLAILNLPQIEALLP